MTLCLSASNYSMALDGLQCLLFPHWQSSSSTDNCILQIRVCICNWTIVAFYLEAVLIG